MSAVVASNLVKRFGEKLAVADTSFAVGDGEFLVLGRSQRLRKDDDAAAAGRSRSGDERRHRVRGADRHQPAAEGSETWPWSSRTTPSFLI